MRGALLRATSPAALALDAPQPLPYAVRLGRARRAACRGRPGRRPDDSLDHAESTSSAGRRPARCDSTMPGLPRALPPHVDDDGVHLRDLDPTNPSTLDGRGRFRRGCAAARAHASASGPRPSCCGTRAIQSVPHGITEAGACSCTSTALRGRAPPVKVHFPEEPRRPEGHRLPLLASLAPLVLSGALALAMRSPVMLLFALMSPVCCSASGGATGGRGGIPSRAPAPSSNGDPGRCGPRPGGSGAGGHRPPHGAA